MIIQLFKISFVARLKKKKGVEAYQQLTTQKKKTNHDETSLQDYSDLKGSPFLRAFATVAWEIYFCDTRTSLRPSSKWEVDL